jgi:MPBQ/MSBQ methyltransferase
LAARRGGGEGWRIGNASERWYATCAGVGRDRVVGGGRRLSAVRAALARQPFETATEEDLTDATSPSIDIERGLYTVIGHAVARIDAGRAAMRPHLRRGLARALRLALSERRCHRLHRRLMERDRTAGAFARHDRSMLFRLRRA